MNCLSAIAALALAVSPVALAQSPDTGDFAGAERCLDCHNTLETGHSTHEKVLGRGDTALFRCEACHGPSADHARRQPASSWVAPPVTFDRDASAFSGNAQCLDCHGENLQQHWTNSAHDLGALSCTNCHGAHDAEDPALASHGGTAVCSDCHDDLLQADQLSGHHPFADRDVDCASCHDPHGTNHLLRCTECHSQDADRLARQDRPVRQFHETAQRNDLGCARCHSGVAHGVPDWVNEWQQAQEDSRE